jgi:hypothetical protein
MAKAKPKSLETDAAVQAAVDELLGAFAAPEGTDADESGFEESSAPPVRDADPTPRTAPSADADALWGGGRKKP